MSETPAHVGIIKSARLYRMMMPEHTCPYGLKALDLLKRSGFAVEDHHLATRQEVEAFKVSHDVATTPQIFMGERRIGGYDDLRRFLGKRVTDPKATSYRPVIALFAMTLLMALAASFAVHGTPFTLRAVLRLAPRQIAAPGALIAAGALFWLSFGGQEFTYAVDFMPAAFCLGFGFAMGVVSLTLTAVKGVAAHETGIASALLNAFQQIGVAFGLAVLSTVSVTTTAGRMPDALAALYGARGAGNAERAASAGDALIHGYGLGLVTAALALLAAAALIAVLVKARRDQVAAAALD